MIIVMMITLKLNVTAQIELELAYYNIAVEHVSHGTTGSPPSPPPPPLYLGIELVTVPNLCFVMDLFRDY